MATYTIIKLTNLSPLHIGTGKENYDFSASELHSDTISSALASILAQYRNVVDIEHFLSTFTISSAFPFWNHYYFFPKPIGKLNILIRGIGEHEYAKKLKNIKYIETSIWQKLVQGHSVEIQEKQIHQECIIPLDDNAFPVFYKSQVNERVSVPRIEGQQSDPFFFDWNYFDNEAGLFCLIKTQSDNEHDIIDLFQILGEVGLGTDKNIGGGKFSVTTDSIDIIYPTHPNATMLLSLFIPTEKELNSLILSNSKYKLLLRSGYISGSTINGIRHLRKKSIYMFDVGSIFPTTEPLNGKIVDLQPDWNEPIHSVFRSGKPIYIPINLSCYE